MSAVLYPLARNLIVQKHKQEEEKTEGGLILPETATKSQSPNTGVVRAIGADVTCCQPGDIVVMPKYCGTRLSTQDDNLVIVCESDLLCLIRDESEIIKP